MIKQQAIDACTVLQGAISHTHTYRNPHRKKQSEWADWKRKERQWSAEVFNSNPENCTALAVLTMPLSVNKKLKEREKKKINDGNSDFKHSLPH